MGTSEAVILTQKDYSVKSKPLKVHVSKKYFSLPSNLSDLLGSEVLPLAAYLLCTVIQ